jgi:hypothetical protein
MEADHGKGQDPPHRAVAPVKKEISSVLVCSNLLPDYGMISPTITLGPFSINEGNKPLLNSPAEMSRAQHFFSDICKVKGT